MCSMITIFMRLQVFTFVLANNSYSEISQKNLLFVP